MTDLKHQFEIVRATMDHLDPLVPLFDAYRVFYQQPSDEHRARVFLGDRILNRESVIFLALAKEESRANQGLGFTQLYPSFSSVSTKRLWILNDLYVTKAARRWGVGRQLMDRARAFAEETCAKGLILETAADNQPAQALYEDIGYERDIEYHRYFLNL